MTTPYIVISDSEDEYTLTTIIYLSDTDSDDEMYTAMLGTPTVSPDGSLPEDELPFPAPTAGPQAATLPTPAAPTGGDDSDEEEDVEEDPSEEDPSEDEPMEEDSTEEEIEIATTPAPVDTPSSAPSFPPLTQRRHGPRTRLTARKSVRSPRQECDPDGPIFFSDIHVDPTATTTPIPATTSTIPPTTHTTTPTPTFVTTTPITTTTPISTAIPAATTIPIPQDYSSQYRDWTHSTLQAWRRMERVPSTFRVGESSTAPAPVPVSTILVARLARLEQDQRSIEQDFGRYASRTATHVRQSIETVRRDSYLMDQAASDTHARVMHTRRDLATLQTRIEASERRISWMEETIRRMSSAPGASSSMRPGHAPR